MYTIGVISDTHGLLREEVKEHLRHCDAILHGGDIHKPEVLEELKQLAPLYVVRGNADKEWAEDLPKQLEITLFGIPITMIHNKKELSVDDKRTGLVVFGHSHKYTETKEGNLFFLNPGSCGPRRFYQPVTMAVIEVPEDGKYEIKKIDITVVPAPEAGKLPTGKQDRRNLVKAVIRDIDRGIPVERIAANRHIDAELTEQICRMYLTHPGVDIDGILNRIGE